MMHIEIHVLYRHNTGYDYTAAEGSSKRWLFLAGGGDRNRRV